MFYNYTAVVDMTVFLLCIVLLMLLGATYTQRSRRYRFVIAGLLNLMFISFLSISFNYYVLPDIGHFSYNFAFLMHDILYIALICQLGLYVFYIFDLIKYRHRWSNFLMVLLFIVFVILEFVSTFTDLGISIRSSISYDESHDVLYLVWYTIYLLIIAFIILAKNKVIIRRIYIAILASICISIYITFTQFYYNTETFTVASYFIPIMAVILLFHCNSYDSNLGAVDRNALSSKMSTLIQSGRRFILVHVEVPDFATIEELPQTSADFVTFTHAMHYKDYLFRYNEDSFVMIFPANTDLSRLEELFDSFHQHYQMSHSITVIESNSYCHSLKDYMELCRVFHSGKPIYRITEADLARFNRANIIKKELEDIERKGNLDDPRVKVYCQPILDVQTKTFTTAESLMRLELDELGFIYPDVFIPIAETDGRIHILTRIILNKVCRYIEEHPNIERISVNFSMYEISKPFFYEDIIHIITSYSFDKRKLGFEVTESIDADDFDLIQSVLARFRSLGITIYLDDFGTGYSNIEHITKLPIDVIKFDRSLVTSSGQNATSMEIVSNLSNMFNIIGYSILYEGIEDGNDQNRCVKLKAQYLQGFMYSRPIPIEQLSDFIGKKYENEVTIS